MGSASLLTLSPLYSGGRNAVVSGSHMEKNAIRRQALALRGRLNSVQHRSLSLAAQAVLIGSDVFRSASGVALYSPVNNEVDTGAIFRAAVESGKRVYYPRVDRSNIGFCRVRSLTELVAGAFNVPEPVGEVVSTDLLDLIVLPGVAFDREGRRLGYGKGFYDRFLAAVSADVETVGLAFELQVGAPLPEEPHDRKISYLATEAGLFPC